MKLDKMLFVMLAKSLSEEQVLDKLKSSIEEFEESKLLDKDLESARHQLKLALHLAIMNTLEMDAEGILNQMDIVNKRVNFFEQKSKN